jgi:hypothetical protein
MKKNNTEHEDVGLDGAELNGSQRKAYLKIQPPAAPPYKYDFTRGSLASVSFKPSG